MAILSYGLWDHSALKSSEDILSFLEGDVSLYRVYLQAFCKPLVEAKVLSAQDAEKIFVNWNELIICNKKLLQ